jgi:F-type H+-transporting ATPase subunit b
MKRRSALLLLLAALVVGPAFAQEHAPDPAAGKKAEGQEEGQKAEEHEGGSRELIWKIVNFVLFFGAAGYFLRKPAGDFFAGRTRAIQQGMAEAKEAREQGEKRLAEMEQRLARLGEEIAALRAGAAREDATAAERMRQATEAESAKILANAEAEISTLARAARQELKAFTSDLAVELAAERLKKEMTPEAQGRLLQHYVADLSDGKGGKN